jgi:hypothetical protein
MRELAVAAVIFIILFPIIFCIAILSVMIIAWENRNNLEGIL